MHRTRAPQLRHAVALTAAAVLCLAAAFASTGCTRTDLARPDILLVTVDALHVEALACHGGAGDLGPDVCSIGDQGSRFVWAFASADSTAAAVATLLTGESPETHRVGPNAASFLSFEARTLAEQVSEAGYATAAFVHAPALNRSRHFDQGFGLFDDGSSPSRVSPSSGATDTVSHAAQWLAAASSPFFAWVHLSATAEPNGDASSGSRADSAETLRRIDRDLSRLLAVLDGRSTPPAILLTSLPGPAKPEADEAAWLAPASTRVALLWSPPRADGGRGVARVIRTPVSQIDVAPTLLRAAGIPGAESHLPGHPLPFRERRTGEAGRTLEVKGTNLRGLIGEGVYLVIDAQGEAVGVAQLPLAGDRAPALGDASRSEDLVSRLWASPKNP